MPCGGSITVAIHVLKDVASLQLAVTRLSERHPTAFSYAPNAGRLILSDLVHGTGWKDDIFITVYHPPIRTLVSGESFEVARFTALMRAAEMEAIPVPDRFHSSDVKQLVDGYTAIVLMHHVMDKEMRLLEVALESDAYYIGALGSRRTHDKRILRLREIGYEQAVIDRIKAPIGMFGPARHATSLAISILADVAVTREKTPGH